MPKNDEQRELHHRSQKEPRKTGKDVLREPRDSVPENAYPRRAVSPAERSSRREPSIARSVAERSEQEEEYLEKRSRHTVNEQDDQHDKERSTEDTLGSIKRINKVVLRDSRSQSIRSDERSSQDKLAGPGYGKELHLSSVAQQFIQISLNNNNDCFDFIKNNRSIQHESRDSFPDAARVALRSSKLDDVLYAKRCIHRAILLRNLLEDKAAAAEFVNGIRKENAQVLREFVKAHDTVYDHIKGEVKPDDSAARLGSVEYPSEGLHSEQIQTRLKPLQSRHSATTVTNYRADQQSFRHGYMDDNSDTRSRHELPASDLSPGLGSLNLGDNMASQNRHSAHPRTMINQTSDSRYQRHPRGFFGPGRVFEVQNHATSGAPTFSQVTIEELQNQAPFHLYIHRLVVVRNHHNACTCVRIRTYRERGLVQLRLSQKEIDAHAIIHLEHEAATSLPQEPTMNIGRVAAESLPYLERYYKEERSR